MNHKSPPQYDFGFIAGTILGIGLEIWTNPNQVPTISKPQLKKFLRMYTEQIPDHIDYLVDHAWTEIVSADIKPQAVQSSSSKKQPSSTKIKRFLARYLRGR